MPAQKIGGKRFVLSRSKRLAHVNAEVLAAHAALETHQTLLAAMPQPTATDALAAAESQLGKPYCLAGCRCSPGCSCRDCSGEVIYGVNQAGLAFPCTSSFAIAKFCSDHGTLIPMEQAIWTPYAIGIRNPWDTPSVNGANGHVWACRGNGRETIEEGGRRTGCYHGSVFNKGANGQLVVWALFPGLAYQSRSRGDGEMILQTKPNGDLKPSPIKGRHAGHMVAPDGLSVLGVNGGSVKGDEPAGDVGPHVRRWYPISVGQGQSISIARRANDTGLIVTRSDGVEVSQDYS